MPVLNAALVGAEKTPLEKRSNGVDSRHDLVGQLRAVADDSDLVLVAGRRQPAITAPSAGMDHRSGRHGIPDEWQKASRIKTRDAFFCAHARRVYGASVCGLRRRKPFRRRKKQTAIGCAVAMVSRTISITLFSLRRLGRRRFSAGSGDTATTRRRRQRSGRASTGHGGPSDRESMPGQTTGPGSWRLP